MKRTYITTSIPYVNAKPHIGHALELVQADVIARHHRLNGNFTILQTGTDENALKNVLAAREKGTDPQTFVDENSLAFLKLTQLLDISVDRFIRTTNTVHKEGVHAFWKRLRTQDIYKKSYSLRASAWPSGREGGIDFKEADVRWAFSQRARMRDVTLPIPFAKSEE